MEVKRGIHFVEGPGGVVYAHKLADRLSAPEVAVGRAPLPFRAPHYTCSTVSLFSELAISAGGVMYLDEVGEFKKSSLWSILSTWWNMDPRVRPVLVLGYVALKDSFPGGAFSGLRQQLADAQEKRLAEIRELIGDVVVKGVAEELLKELA